MTAWTITTAVTFSDMDGGGTDYAAGDTLTINSGGTVTADLSIGGAGSGVITVNAGGKLIVNPGISILWANTAGMTLVAGGIVFINGTSANPCYLTGGGTATTTNKIISLGGGKFYASYCIFDEWYWISTNMEWYNCGSLDVQYLLYGLGAALYGGNTLIVNCSIAQSTASRFCFHVGYAGTLTAINTAFTSTTDNFLGAATYICKVTLANCTYQGVAIAADDFGATTFDTDIRIYEASVMTVAANLAGVSVSPKHPSQDSMGFLYDTTNYMKMPAFLSVPDVTGATGATSFFGLQKSAYWPSGLAVGSRTWKYWSDSGQAETGDNQKITATASKVGYVTATDTDWIGAAMTATVSLPTIYLYFCDIFTYVSTVRESMFVSGVDEWVQFDGNLAISGALTLNFHGAIYTAAEALVEDDIFSIDKVFAGAQSQNNFLSTYSGESKPAWEIGILAAGTYYLLMTVTGTGFATIYQRVYFEIIDPIQDNFRFDGETW